ALVARSAKSALVAKFAVARFAQGFGQGFGLFGRKVPLVAEDAGEPERVEQKRVHGGTMRRYAAKVQPPARFWEIAGFAATRVRRFFLRANVRLPIDP
ncbi:MAG TPA: hypothetical protein VHT48_09335, partial [Methylocella sp.]|nr:hypothetical protein [Methylocella sp.]